jgi:tetratricopeptide (TPR) repeat protein
MTVIRQWFAALHSTLDELIFRYPHATDEEKNELMAQFSQLKSLSDEVLEHWLQYEDKLSYFMDMAQQGAAHAPPELQLADFQKGQGYFKLSMFSQAAQHLEKTVQQYPDLLSARLYLGMSRMHLKEWDEAQRHFRMIAALADEPRLKAVAYNALGCIQAVFARLDQARQFFLKALEADPSFEDPRENLEYCRKGGGEFKLQFGSAQLHAMV